MEDRMALMLNKVAEVSAIHPFGLKVRFSDGAGGLHDCLALVNETGPMIEPLRNPAYFARVSLDYGAPTWPNSFDMCPDSLRMKMKQAGELVERAW
jgi:Protein of unknown function (DUF2442)